jgi:iron complex outermembrane receptor protein
MTAGPSRAVLFASLAMAAGSAAQASPRPFHITEGNAARALNEFRVQAGVDVSAIHDVSDMTTRAVEGSHEPAEALRLMFVDTSLVGLPIVSNTVAVVDCSVVARFAARRPLQRATRTQAKACRKAHKLGPEREPELQAAATLLPNEEDAAREVLVTGTRIRRARGEILDPSLHIVTPDDMERTAGGTLAEALQAQPSVHGSGPTDDTFETGTDAPTNSGRGIGTNLRGFGAGASLPLVNGHRTAASGTDAAFTDISNIPSLFIERTELLTDAASAVYGSDAIGGVVNIITRQDFTGSVTRIRYGAGEGSVLKNGEFGQLFGKRWGRLHWVFGVAIHSTDALPSSRRALATSDLTRWGGGNFDTLFTNPGNVVMQDGRILGIPRNQDGTSLTLADLLPMTNLGDRMEHNDVIASQKLKSSYGSMKFAVNDRLMLTLDGHFAHRQARAAAGSASALLRVPNNNPLAQQLTTPGGFVSVAYDFFDDLGQRELVANVRTDFVTGRLQYDFANEWYIDVHVRRATERVHQINEGLFHFDNLLLVAPVFNPFGDGSFTPTDTIDQTRTTGHTVARSRLGSVGIDASGPLTRNTNLGLGLEYRDQSLRTDIVTPGFSEEVHYGGTRDAIALSAELAITLVPESAGVRFVRKLEVSSAARYEKFFGYGEEGTPRFKVKWSPSQSLTVFGNWSQSFRLPPLGQLFDDQNGSLLQSVPGPLAGGTTALVEFGKNSQLKPETAESWSVGFRVAPPESDIDLRLSYFDVHIRNRIESTSFTQALLSDPELAHLIIFNPTFQQRKEVCDRTEFHSLDPGACLNAPINALIDVRLRNLAVLQSRGVEIGGTWTGEAWSVDLKATRVIDYEQGQTDRHPLIENVDTQHQPLDFRAVGTVEWRRGAFAVAGTLNYSDGYHDQLSVPNRLVDSWATFDVVLSHAFELASVMLVAENLLDEDPPFFNNPIGMGYDPENADLKGRRLSLVIQKSW